MRAIDGAVSLGAEVKTYRVPDKTDGAPFAAQLIVENQEVVTHYAETVSKALGDLEEYLGQCAVASIERGMEEPEPTPAKSTRVDDVLDAGRDLRRKEVWVCFGEHGKARELVMPFKDASNLRALLESMDLRQRDQS